MKWIISVDDTKSKVGLASFKKGVQDIDTTTKGAGRNIKTNIGGTADEIRNKLKSAETEVTTLKTKLQDLEKGSTSLGTKLKDSATKFSTLGLGISTTMTSAIQLGRSYRDLEDAQIAVDRTSLKMSRTQEAANKAQGKLNELVGKGIKSGAEYEQALLDVQQTTDAATLAVTMHGEALEAQGDTYMNFAMSVIPTVIGSVSTMSVAIKELGINTSKLKGFFSGAMGQMTILGAGIAGAAVVISSYIQDVKRTETLHSVFDAHVRDWGRIKDAINAAISGIEADPVALVIKSLSGSLGELKKELALADNLSQTGSIVDKILFGKQIDYLPPNAKASVKTKLQFIKDILANPNNFKDAWFTNTTLDTVKRTLGEVEVIVKDAIPVWSKYADTINVATEAHKNLVLWAEKGGGDTKDVSMLIMQELGKMPGIVGDVSKDIMSTYDLALDTMDSDTVDWTRLQGQHWKDFAKSPAEQFKLMRENLDDMWGGVTTDMFKAADLWKSKLTSMQFPRLESALGIKVDDDRITKKILDYIPDSITKEIKVHLKESATLKSAAEGITETLYAALADPKMNDKKMDKVVEGIMKMLAEKFPNNPAAQKMIDALAGTIGSKDTETEVAKLLAEWDAAPIPITFTPKDLNLLSKAISEGIYGTPVVVEPIFPGGGFDWPSDKPPKKDNSDIPKVLKTNDLNRSQDIDKMLDEAEIDASGINQLTPDQKRRIRILFEQKYGIGKWGTGDAAIYDPSRDAVLNWYKHNKDPKNQFGMYAWGTNPLGPDSLQGRTKPLTNIAFGTGSQGTGTYRDPLGFMATGGGGGGGSPVGKMKEDLSKANPLDLFARQIDQITKNLNVLARAVNQNTTNMNMYARTIVQVTKDNNVYAKTIVQVTTDHNFLARTVDQVTKNNNVLARTIVQVTKNNNTYARTVAEVTKDHNTFARTQVQITKNNNTLARTVNQLTSNFKALASALNKIPRNITITTHYKTTGTPPRKAQHGMHETLEEDTVILAHKGERVDIGAHTSNASASPGGGGAGGGGGTPVVVEVHNHHDTFTEIRMLKHKMGAGRSVFGP